MIPNFDFIKNRSFEIAWAIFRCAALFGNEKLKKEIESSAIDLVINYDNLKLSEKEVLKIAGQIVYIEKLISLIKLAEAVKEINAVNANVLFRELNNLAKLIRQSIGEYRQNQEDASAIEFMFAEKPMSFAELEIGKQTKNVSENSQKFTMPNFSNKSANQNIGNSLENKQIVETINNNRLAETIKNNTTSMASAAQVAGSVMQSRIGLGGSAIKKERTAADSKPWQDLIFKKILEIGQVSTRELSIYFPEISERTIRFYLQRLTESGMITRIGNTGPGSYYQLPKR